MKTGQLGRWGALLVVGLGACEVLIMISPFAGFFYASVRFEPFLGFLSTNPTTAWLDGFFLNHSVVTTSTLLEWQREIGGWLFTLGAWGFLISAAQVYGNKLLQRGVATGLLYRVSRHPQYLCLSVAGWGLLTIWPRFLLLGFWITMLFLYAALARFEERRMEERFGDEYRSYAATRGAFFPGSPVRRLFEASFGRLRPRRLGWVAAYASCMIAAFLVAGLLRGYTRGQTVVVERAGTGLVAISAWPQTEDWVSGILDAVLEDERVQGHLEGAGERPLVATILPDRYVMKGMYYKMPVTGDSRQGHGLLGDLLRVGGLVLGFLLPIEGVTLPADFMGIDPDESAGPVEVVISRAEKPYKDTLALDEALDASVRLTPLLVAEIAPAGDEVTGLRVPLPQNRWGPHVVMPLF
jgi:protein-S-isoprenylcysteine O-methyltransferase Ste14